MLKYRKLIFILGVLFVFSCNSEKKIRKTEEDKSPLFLMLSPEITGINFVNKIYNTKDYNIFKYRNFYNGGGVAIGDINNDDLPDVYMTSNFGENKLYLNKGNFKFEDITEIAKVKGNKDWSTGVVFVDINSDGFLDIYVCNAGSIKGNNRNNELFINNGDLTFSEKAESYGIADSGFSTHATFFDYDLDGDIDVYLLNNSFIPINSLGMQNKRNIRGKDWNINPIYKGGGDKLLENRNGNFIDVSEKAGIYGSLIGFGLGVAVGHFNDDFLPDIYVSNDFYERDYLYINQGNSTFKESVKDYMGHLSLSSMGTDMADINNDGKLDIFITDMLPEKDDRLKETTQFEGYDVYQLKLNRDFYHQYIQNTLQLNNGNNTFSEIAFYSGVARTDWSWGTLIFDMDNDGFKDIFVTNGIYHDLTNKDFMDFFANEVIQKMVITGKKEKINTIINKMPSTPLKNYAFKNNQNITFENKADEWGFEKPSFSNGFSYADLDNDGDLDLIINNVNQQAFVYKNNADKRLKNNFIKIKLKQHIKNNFAIGSSVSLFIKDKILRNDVMPTRGFQSSVDYTLNFGIGKKQKIDSIRVIWPNEKIQTVRNVKPNQTLTIRYNIKKTNKKTLKIKKTLLTTVNSYFVKHEENQYIDFDYEGLILEKLSQEGPTISVADINNDKNEDIFLGGAKGQSGVIYFQTNKGKFIKKQQPELEKDKKLEDTASLFFDANKDGNIDLLVSTGGNEINEEKKYINRLYLNDGKGNFDIKKILPSTYHNVSTIAPNDFDNDGDIDLFIGSRSVIGIYGVNPRHLLLENDGKGNFKDITSQKAFDLKNVGMITYAIWSDVDGDQKKDLVVVGDWMAPTIFKNNGRRLKKIKTSLNELTGWWNVIQAEDIDNDGDEDFIIGNQGTNIPYKPSKKNMMKLWVNDFDENGTIEQIVTQNINKKDMPLQMKKEMFSQIVSIRKQNIKAKDYAKKPIDLLFDEEVLKKSIVKNVIQSKTIIAMNKGNNIFEIIELPKEVQFSCICSILCSDINNDGNLDLLLGGNNFEYKPQYGKQDANYGSLLLGDGTGNFSWMPYSTSGFFVKGEVKSIKMLKNKNKNHFYIIARNNDTPKLFQQN